jgi:MYXO-CTERM domain-containing protein
MKSSYRIGAILFFGAICSAVSADVFSTYEDLGEGFKGQTFTYDAVTYRDVNNVSGFYPDGMPFGPNDNGNEVIVERAVPFYNDFPTYGSPFNSLTFGSAFVPGDNLTIGALASVWMDLPSLSNGASFDLGYYENGPWGGIRYTLDALRNGQVVATDSFIISNLGGRDNPTFDTMSISGVEFDQLHLYGWLNDAYTAPRGMIDDLSITAVPEPGALGLAALAGMLLIRRRRAWLGIRSSSS